MISVSGKNWEENFLNKRIVEKVKLDHDFSDIISKLIISRNFDQLEINTINKKIELTNPFTRKFDFIESNNILNKAIKNNKKIFIIGDYDVDGCVSAALFVNFFKEIKKNVNYYIPNRFKDGYGAGVNLIKKIVKKNPDLIILLDCGSNSYDSIDLLNKKKIKTLIIDHHEINKPYPKSNGLINPKKECDYKEYNYFSAATLSYFFIDFYIKKNKLKIDFTKYLIFVLLSIICDVMPLRKINRIIALKVLDKFHIKKNFLFNKIFDLKKINRPLEINDFGFLIGPLLNSAGRLDNPNKVVDLLTSENPLIIEKIIKDLIKINEKRKKIENDSIKEIDFNKINTSHDNVIVIYDKFFNEGIIGIIASRIKEYFGKPCVVLTKSGKIYKASARSTSNFNIGKYIKHAIDKDIIINGGGHNLAAGFSINLNKIPLFIDFINSMYSKNKITYDYKYISRLSFSAINSKFYKDIMNLGPFGQNNANPIFLVENTKIIKPKILKDKYISFYIKSNYGKLISGICFDLLESETSKNLLHNKNTMNLIVQIKENLWNNKKNLQLVVLDAIHCSNKA
jgi:single-stranded-DNA-specific exonuclease